MKFSSKTCVLSSKYLSTTLIPKILILLLWEFPSCFHNDIDDSNEWLLMNIYLFTQCFSAWNFEVYLLFNIRALENIRFHLIWNIKFAILKYYLMSYFTSSLVQAYWKSEKCIYCWKFVIDIEKIYCLFLVALFSQSCVAE